MTRDRPLTETQKRFLDEYLVTLNATQAYRAVFPDTTYRAAKVGASRMLAKANLRAEIRAARADQQRRTRVRADAVLRELARIASSDIIDFFDPDGLLLPARRIPIDARRAVQSIKVRRERVRTDSTVTRRGRDTVTTTTTTTESVVEVRFWDKLAALEKLARHLGLSQSIPPLEALLLSFPPDLAAAVRDALAAEPDSPPTPER